MTSALSRVPVNQLSGHLDSKVDFETSDKLELCPKDVDALVAFMEALDGEGYQDKAPAIFPR